MAATFSQAPAAKVYDATASQATGAVSTGIGFPAVDAATGSTIANERIGGTDFNLTVNNPAVSSAIPA
jgi:hypothetical protein